MDKQFGRFERQIYRSVADDGIWDLMLGVALVAIGGGIAIGWPQLGAFVTPVVIVAGSVRTFVTTRRAGSVRFGQARAGRLRRATLVVPAVALVLLLLLLAADRRLPDLAKAALLLAVPVAVAGHLLEIPRLFAYAAIILAAMTTAIAGALPAPLALALAGLAILIMGGFAFGRFLRRYPRSGIV